MDNTDSAPPKLNPGPPFLAAAAPLQAAAATFARVSCFTSATRDEQCLRAWSKS